MQKKGQQRVNLFFPILIILVLGAVGVVIYYVTGAFNVQTADKELRNDMQRLNKPDIEELSDTEQQQKINECKTTPSAHQKDWCYLELAKNYDIDACNDIIQIDFKSYCNAIITGETSSCKDIATGSIKDACYISLAQLTLNPSLCKQTSRVEYCKSLVS